MEALKHPEYDFEKKRLKNTKEAIDIYIQGNIFSKNVFGADDWANDVIKVQNASKRREYINHRSSPYFSRVDFCQDGKSIENIYFGYRGLNLGDYEVIEWRAPIGRLMTTSSERQKIKVPEGFLSGSLSLRRRFRIDNGKLATISDEIDRRQGSNWIETVSGEEFLIEEISMRGDLALKDIVKTIQEQQDDIIRSPHEGVIVINGVAGSGKTSIAIHRLAYLLFPDNQTNIRASASIVFCPNQVFLGYISDLLPNLGEKDVIQTTFYDWVVNQMIYANLENGIRIRGIYQEKFMNSNSSDEELERLRKIARIKGKINFRIVLENYIAKMVSDLKLPKKMWRYQNLGELKITLEIKKEKFKGILADIKTEKKNLDSIREKIYLSLQKALEDSYDEFVWAKIASLKGKSEAKKRLAKSQLNLADQAEYLSEASTIRKEAARFQNQAFADKQLRRTIIQMGINCLKKDYNEWWPPINVVVEYCNLINDKKNLRLVADGVLSSEEIEILSSISISEDELEYEDITAIYCLYRLVYPEMREPYDYIVIDEAQDFSPMQFDILRQFSKHGITIVGDLAQGIHSYRGISRWDELRTVFQSTKIQFENISQSYRSSKEIVALSNNILQKIYKESALLAKSLGRSTGRPIVIQRSSQVELKVELVNQINRLNKKYKHIAVLAKNDSECKEIGEYLESQKIISSYVTSDAPSGFVYSGGVVALSIALSKGIEFEAVIIFNASDSEYDLSKKYDGHLLYVAITRALHHLTILFEGAITRYLENSEGLVETEEHLYTSS